VRKALPPHPPPEKPRPPPAKPPPHRRRSRGEPCLRPRPRMGDHEDRPYTMRSIDSYISSRAHAVDASGIRKVFDLAAKMKDPINLSIGLPDFDVPDLAKAAAIDAIKSGQNRYTQTQGIAPLRERLRHDLSTEIARYVG